MIADSSRRSIFLPQRLCAKVNRTVLNGSSGQQRSWQDGVLGDRYREIPLRQLNGKIPARSPSKFSFFPSPSPTSEFPPRNSPSTHAKSVVEGDYKMSDSKTPNGLPNPNGHDRAAGPDTIN